MRGKSFLPVLFLSLLLARLGAQSGGTDRQLIVCFPSSREISLTGEVDTVTYASGNTLSLTRIIQELTGADLFEIDLTDPYSTSYNTVLMEAKEDQKKRVRRGIRNRVDHMEAYDVIFLGFPNWWASIPMPVAAFLESYDLSGKRIIPFCTHGGGRFGQSVSAIAKLCPASEIMEPLAVSYGGGPSLRKDIGEWLEDNGVRMK